MALKIENFDPHQMFFESWEQVLQGFILISGVRGHLRSSEVIKGQTLFFWPPPNYKFPESLVSEVIWGRERSLEIKFQLELTHAYYMFLESWDHSFFNLHILSHPSDFSI